MNDFRALIETNNSGVFCVTETWFNNTNLTLMSDREIISCFPYFISNFPYLFVHKESWRTEYKKMEIHAFGQ